MVPLPMKTARFRVTPASVSNHRTTTVAPSLKASLPHDSLLSLSKITARYWDLRVVPSWLPASCLGAAVPEEEVVRTVPWVHRLVKRISGSSSPNSRPTLLMLRVFPDRMMPEARLRASWPNRWITCTVICYQRLNFCIDRHSKADRSVATPTASTLSAAARF